MRLCDICKAHMGSHMPRRQVDGQMLCPACVDNPRGGYVSAALGAHGMSNDGPMSFEDHFNDQMNGLDEDPTTRDSDVLHKRYKGQPGKHGLSENGKPHYEIDHPSGWLARTDGGPQVQIGHVAHPGEFFPGIDVSHASDYGDPTKIHPAMTGAAPSVNHNMFAAVLSDWVKKAGDHTASLNPAIKQWQEMNGMKNEGMKKQAHDSGDGETIYHCPFCGSGQVIARSDRTIECEFCHTCFTVQVQPEFSAFPQTINGMPVQVPGMPGQSGVDPMGGADPMADPMGGGMNPDGTPMDPEVDPMGGGEFPPAGEDGGDPAEQESEEEDDEGPPKKGKDGGNPFTSSLRGKAGKIMAFDDYLAHLAVTHTTNRERTIALIRERRNRRG